GLDLPHPSLPQFRLVDGVASFPDGVAVHTPFLLKDVYLALEPAPRALLLTRDGPAGRAALHHALGVELLFHLQGKRETRRDLRFERMKARPDRLLAELLSLRLQGG